MSSKILLQTERQKETKGKRNNKKWESIYVCTLCVVPFVLSLTPNAVNIYKYICARKLDALNERFQRMQPSLSAPKSKNAKKEEKTLFPYAYLSKYNESLNSMWFDSVCL